MEQQVKLVPYGVADFATVIEQNLYYVDKTMFIPELEKQPRNLFFIRPRRFGKSIFLSMLYSYYDCTQSHKFQSLFGNLWIGQHPTPLQGKYQVLFLDFSQITGNIDKLETKFNSYLSINLDAFVRQYSEYYQAEMEEILAQEDFEEKMELIFKAAKAHQYHLYLIIDEYLSAPTQYRVLYLHIISEMPLSSEYPDRHHKNPADIQRDYISYQAHRCQ